MSRNDFLVRIAAAAIGIVAIAIAAATVRSPVEPGGDGGTGPGAGGSGSGEGRGPPPTATDPVDGGNSVPALLEYLAYAIILLLALALAWYLIAHRREMVRMIAVYLGVGLLVLALIAAFLHFGVADELNVTQAPMEEPGGEFGEGGEPGAGEGEAESMPFGPLLGVLAVLTMIFVGALFLSAGSGEDDSAAVSDVDAGEDATDAAAVGAAAGRAAERIETADEVDNEVYRAWREMTDLLEVSRPETSTPGEFASAAVEAGLGREHVDELTRLFEDVRYGHTETTDEMEARAVAVLRRIESEYALESESDRPVRSTRGSDGDGR